MQLIATAMVLLAGCALEVDDSEFDTWTQELRCSDGYGNPINDSNCPWKGLWRVMPADGNDIVHNLAPALCVKDGYPLVVFSAGSDSRYRTLLTHYVPSQSWGFYGNKQFSSKPTCAMRENGADGQGGFVVAGKGTDNKIYASPGLIPAIADPQPSPQPVVGPPGYFTAVSNTTYTTGGSPALASGSSKMVMVFMGDDRRIYAHVRGLPYLSNSWSSRISGPQLPAGWTPIGAPAIARAAITFQIVVHARNGQQDRLFEVHFYDGHNHFSNGIGSPTSNFVMLPNMGRIDDDPALTIHDVHGPTVYFRRYNPNTGFATIMQTTGVPLGSNPVFAVKPNDNVNYASGPAAIANWAIESQNGRHTVLARTTGNQLRAGVTLPDVNIVP